MREYLPAGMADSHCGPAGHTMACPSRSPELRRMSNVPLQPGQWVHVQTRLLSGQWRASTRPVRQIGHGVSVIRLIGLTWVSIGAATPWRLARLSTK